MTNLLTPTNILIAFVVFFALLFVVKTVFAAGGNSKHYSNRRHNG